MYNESSIKYKIKNIFNFSQILSHMAFSLTSWKPKLKTLSLNIYFRTACTFWTCIVYLLDRNWVHHDASINISSKTGSGIFKKPGRGLYILVEHWWNATCTEEYAQLFKGFVLNMGIGPLQMRVVCCGYLLARQKKKIQYFVQRLFVTIVLREWAVSTGSKFPISTFGFVCLTEYVQIYPKLFPMQLDFRKPTTPRNIVTILGSAAVASYHFTSLVFDQFEL